MIDQYIVSSMIGFVLLLLIAVYFYKEHTKTLSIVNAYRALWKVQSLILSTLDFEESVKNITNIILTELNYMKLGYVIIVLALVDEKKNVLRRIGLSHTESAEAFLKTYPLPYRSIEISLNESENLGVQAIKDKQVKTTSDMSGLLTPAVDPAFVSNLQHKIKVKNSMVYPIIVQNKSIGILIFSMLKEFKKVSYEEKTLLDAFTNLVGLAVQNSTLFTSVKEGRDSLAKVNQQVLTLNEKLKELDKLKDDFVSVASHELRTPMTAIKSYSWMALNRADEPLTEKMKKYLNRTLISTDRLINLVNDLLNISRIESGRIGVLPQAFDVRELVEEVITEVTPKASEKSLHINLLRTRIPEVFADPDKVHQVLLNLVGNSLKFTPENGSITIATVSDGTLVEVSVRDSGVGISKEDIPRLFSKFGRLDQSYVAAATSGGTGLGLYICRSLIELMKGKIWVNSEGVGKGTTFTFSLPAVSPKVIAEAEKYTTHTSDEERPLEPAAL